MVMFALGGDAVAYCCLVGPRAGVPTGYALFNQLLLLGGPAALGFPLGMRYRYGLLPLGGVAVSLGQGVHWGSLVKIIAFRWDT